MIACITGKVIAKAFDCVVLETGGVGYMIYMSSRSLSRLPELGETTQVLTLLLVRDDVPVLYGFLSQDEKHIFERLTSVSGVGPKVALAVLSTFDTSTFFAALNSQDVSTIQKVPGVGKKMASRIVLELKDSFEANVVDSFVASPAQKQHALPFVLEALLSMGFSSAEAEVALKGAPETADETLLLQYALKRLGD